MEKKFLRILSFVMVAMFAFTLMGLTVGAEEWDIPVIEEITEEEMGEELVEEEVVETFSEGDEAQIYSATGVAGATYATFAEAIAAVETGGTVKLLRDVVVMEGNAGGKYITINKTFTLDGDGHTLSDNGFDKNSGKIDGAANPATADGGTFKINKGGNLTVKNITFLRPKYKAYGFFWLNSDGAAGTLNISDGTVMKNLSAVHGSAVFVHRTGAVVNIDATSDDVAPQFINCTTGNAIRMFYGTVNLNRGSFTGCGNTSTPAINVSADSSNPSTFNMTGGTINSVFGISVAYPNDVVNITGGTITGGTYAGVKIAGNNTNTVIGGTASIKGNTTGVLIENRTKSGTTYTGGAVTIKNSATLTGNTIAVNVSGTDNVVTVADNATISGGNAGITLPETAILKVEGSPVISGTTAGVKMTKANSIKVTGAFAGEIGVTISDTSNNIQFGTVLEGGSLAEGASFYSDADKNIKFVRWGDCKGAGTANGKSFVNTNFAHDVLDADALILHYNMMRVNNQSGVIEGCTSYASASNVTYYLLKNVNYTEAINPNNQNKGTHVNTSGQTGLVIDGNGFTITRDGTVASQHTFAIYGGTKITFRNLVYDANEKSSRLAYIDGAGGNKDTVIRVENSILYNCTNTNGAIYLSSAATNGTIELHDAVITGNRSAALIQAGKLKLSGKLDISDNKASNGSACNIKMEAMGRIAVDEAISNVNGEIAPCIGINTSYALLGTSSLTDDSSLSCIYQDANSSLKVVRYDSFVGTGSHAGLALLDTGALDSAKEAHKGEIWFNYPVYRVNGTAITGHNKMSEAISLIQSTPYEVYMTKDMAVNEAFTPATSGHVDINGNKVITVIGNGHTMTRTHNGSNKDNFTLYSKMNITFKDFIYDGNGLSHFAYVYGGNNGAQLTLDNCIIYNGYHPNRAGAVSVLANSAGDPALLTIKDTLITKCKGGDGGVYVAADSDGVKLSGKVVIKDNVKNDGTTEMNIRYIAGGKAKIYMTGDITDADGTYTPSVGVTVSQGFEFGEAAETGYKGVDCFFADVETTVTGSYYPEKFGDGELDGEAVITAPEFETGKEKTLILHYPWILVSADGTKETGYISFVTLRKAAEKDSRAIMQKDMVLKNMSVYAEAERDAMYKVTEFPMDAGGGKYIDFNRSNVIIDGNGHTLTVEASGTNPVFVLYSGGNITFENLIYNGAGTKRFARIYEISPANGNEGIYADNCYIVNGNDYVFEGNYHGIIDVKNSTISGMEVKKGSRATLENVTFTGNIASMISVTGTVTLNDVTYPSTVVVKGELNLPEGSRITMGDYTCKLVLDSTYDSEIVVDMVDFGNIAKQISTSGLDKLESRMSVVKRNSTDFAYVDSYTDGVGTLKWAKVPELGLATDSGKYDDGTGLIRFMTTFTKAPINAVENYGTYVIGVSNFEGDPAGITKFGKFENAPTKDGQAYIVDVINIPSDKMDEDITAISFVKIKGITTPIYSYFGTVNFNTAAANGVVKDLGEKA